MAEESQTCVKAIYSEQLHDVRLNDLYLYGKMILDGIREPDKQVEALCLDQFEEINRERAAGIYKSLYGNPLNMFANFYRDGKIIDRERFINIVTGSDDESIKWMVDVNQFDYQRFDLNWLTFCSEAFLRELGSDKDISKKIIEKFYLDYFEGKLEKDVVDKVIKYFLRNQGK